MKFRPCIDLHSGQVKQIVGSTLKDGDEKNEAPKTNFETDKGSDEYARMYKRDNLPGGHVIMLGPGNTEAARSALRAYPQGLQIGGGINDDNAQSWLDEGASHVIVTSFVFKDGQINMDRLKSLVNKVGKKRLVLDLSCRRKPEDPKGEYYVVTDRWQKFTDVAVTKETLEMLSQWCDEFLVHGVDVEGMQCGILEDLVQFLGKHSPVPVTYAGGVRTIEDMDLVKKLGDGKVDLTIGSALDCFGGDLKYDDVVSYHKKENPE